MASTTATPLCAWVACNQQSASFATEYPFYELELNLRPSLRKALDEYVKTENLFGDVL